MGILFVESEAQEQNSPNPIRQLQSSFATTTTSPSDRHRLMTSLLKALSLRPMSRRRLDPEVSEVSHLASHVPLYVAWTDGRGTRSLISLLANFGIVNHWQLLPEEPGVHPCVSVWYSTAMEAHTAERALANLGSNRSMGLPRFYASFEEAPLVPSTTSSLCSLPTPELTPVPFLA